MWWCATGSGRRFLVVLNLLPSLLYRTYMSILQHSVILQSCFSSQQLLSERFSRSRIFIYIFSKNCSLSAAVLLQFDKTIECRGRVSYPRTEHFGSSFLLYQLPVVGFFERYEGIQLVEDVLSFAMTFIPGVLGVVVLSRLSNPKAFRWHLGVGRLIWGGGKGWSNYWKAQRRRLTGAWGCSLAPVGSTIDRVYLVCSYPPLASSCGFTEFLALIRRARNRLESRNPCKLWVSWLCLWYHVPLAKHSAP